MRPGSREPVFFPPNLTRMMHASRLAGLALLAGLSTASAQRSTIARDAYRLRADSLVYTYLAESHAPSAAFAVIRGNDTLAYGAYGLADRKSTRLNSSHVSESRMPTS